MFFQTWDMTAYHGGSNVTGTTIDSGGYCPYCSTPPYSFVYHGDHCPLVKAKEYHQNGALKRVEFHEPQPATINIGEIPDSMKRAREVEIKEPVLLEPGRYTIILRELCKIEDDYPPGLAPLDIDGR